MKKQESYFKQQDLLDHAKNPQNYGLCATPDFVSAEHNPSCGDSVTICGMVSGNMVQEVRFEGKGCVLSLAMASKLTEFVKGMNSNDILLLNHDTVSQLLGMELGPNRIQCGMLSIIALINGVAHYKKG